MTPFLVELSAFLEHIRPWIAPTTLLGIFGLVAKSQIENRRIHRQEAKDRADAGEVAATRDMTDEQDIRDHYAKEVHALRNAMQAQSTRHRDEIQAVEEKHRLALVELEDRYGRRAREAEDRHEICIKDRTELREKVDALRDLTAGFRRIITHNSAIHALELTDPLSTEVKAAAERVDWLFQTGNPQALKEGPAT